MKTLINFVYKFSRLKRNNSPTKSFIKISDVICSCSLAGNVMRKSYVSIDNSMLILVLSLLQHYSIQTTGHLRARASRHKNGTAVAACLADNYLSTPGTCQSCCPALFWRHIAILSLHARKHTKELCFLQQNNYETIVWKSCPIFLRHRLVLFWI